MSPGGGVLRLTFASWFLFLQFSELSANSVRREEGNVGCLFSGLVCTDDEHCYDDEIIGRCISASSHHPAGVSHARGPLEGPQLQLLGSELTRVFGAGFSWPDLYTQCVFQTLIHDIATGLEYSPQKCEHLELAPRLFSLDKNEEAKDDLVEGEDEEDDNPGNIIEDEEGNVYIPEKTLQYILESQEEGQEENEEEGDDLYNPEEEERLSPKDEMEAWAELQQVLSGLDSMSPDVALPLSLEDQVMLISPKDLDSQIREEPFLNQPLVSRHTLEKRKLSSYILYPPVGQDYALPPQDADYSVPEMFVHMYNPQLAYPAIEDDSEDLDESTPEEDTDETPNEEDDEEEVEEEEEDEEDEEEEAEGEDNLDMGSLQKREINNQPTTLMEMLYNTDDSDKDISSYDFDYEDSSEPRTEDDILYYNPDMEPIPVESVFDRRERLDVKKPGPFFANSPNNFFLDKLLEDPNIEEEVEALGQTEYELPLDQHAAPRRPKKDFTGPALATFPDTPSTEDILTIKYNRLDLATQADSLVHFVADHLGLQSSAFSMARQPESSRLVLKVHPNPRNLNATSMAALLNKDQALAQHASKDLNIDIQGFQAGQEDTVDSIPFLPTSRTILLAVLLAATVSTIIATIGVILLIKRRKNGKGKKEEVEQESEEPVKEYKQLVRDWSRSSRASQGDGASQASPSAKRVHKSSNNSEGSRTSSTSSWQEEPTAATTMDISTGHMVLSYMEDHLKNKQRLEQEWVGLCAYEAEPNSTAIAFKVENKKKNRYPDKLPYDHNRVCLNALVNGTNSDYINASSVMDTDPRHPTYIISQGPLANTVADFWQMVWEQGSVVIVMLSKLSENGYQLAQRYWPEEGSEQYHVFEVHLVSEHVWCEDYLVRSLYLKNTQTGETRTVTQFHFQSWPDATIPSSTRAILEFRRKVNKSYRGRSCPMIVHCSDGVGRSGTYVLIDMVLNRMTKGSKEIDIAATLEHIRDQRAGMVQTRSQFEFCLMAVAEETHAILKALPQ